MSADRPGYERTSSSLWKQREEYCAALLQRAWIEYQVKILNLKLVRNVMMIVKTLYVPPLQKAELRKEQRSEGSAGKQIKVKSA